jgi:hypothetical protein
LLAGGSSIIEILLTYAEEDRYLDSWSKNIAKLANKGNRVDKCISIPHGGSQTSPDK